MSKLTSRSLDCWAKMSQFKLASKVAFGTARCAIGVKGHEAALMKALRKGIRGTSGTAAVTVLGNVCDCLLLTVW